MGGIFYLIIAVIAFFFFVYIGGAIVAARESLKFVERFKEKVKANEISGISEEDVLDGLAGRRFFWRGHLFEATAKRMNGVEMIQKATHDPIENRPHTAQTIEIDKLERAVLAAEACGVSQLRQINDLGYGKRIIRNALIELESARRAQLGGSKIRVQLPGEEVAASGSPRGDAIEHALGLSGGGSKVHFETDERKPPAPPTVEPEESSEEEEDFTAGVFETEIAAAKAVGDAPLVQLTLLAMLHQIDSFKFSGNEWFDPASGKVLDERRLLYTICEQKGLLLGYHNFQRAFARRSIKWSHSLPYYRLLEYGWQPSVSHTDFAGILNASALFSFTVGLPQIAFSIAFLSVDKSSRDPAPCEVVEAIRCSLAEDFGRPHIQNYIVIMAMLLSLCSVIMSVCNLMFDLPAYLFEHAEHLAEAEHLSLQAEQATKEWEDRLSVEVQESVKALLKQHEQRQAQANRFSRAKSAAAFKGEVDDGDETDDLADERALLVDVMAIEQRALARKVAYIEHYLKLTEHDRIMRGGLRAGRRRDNMNVVPHPRHFRDGGDGETDDEEEETEEVEEEEDEGGGEEDLESAQPDESIFAIGSPQMKRRYSRKPAPLLAPPATPASPLAPIDEINAAALTSLPLPLGTSFGGGSSFGGSLSRLSSPQLSSGGSTGSLRQSSIPRIPGGSSIPAIPIATLEEDDEAEDADARV